MRITEFLDRRAMGLRERLINICNAIESWAYDPFYEPRDLPHPLAKAVRDNPFCYLVVLRDGTAIECEGVKRSRRGWLFLQNPRKPDFRANLGDSGGIWDCSLDRGLEVRISDIMACADAPHGS